MPCTVKVTRMRKGKGDRNKHVNKGKGKQSVKQRHFDGYCNQCGEYGHKKPDCTSKSKFFNGTCNKCRAHAKRIDCSVKNGGEEAKANLQDAPVRLLLDSGSGVSACSPDFAPLEKTLTESSVRARSATGQVTKSLGKRTVNNDINGTAAGVTMEVLKMSKPILSASKMVRSGRRMVLDEHNSFIEDKTTGKRIPVELTRGDVFEASAYMSSTSHGLRRSQC